MPRRSAGFRFYNLTIRRKYVPLIDKLKQNYDSRPDVVARLILNEYKKTFPLDTTFTFTSSVSKVTKRSNFTFKNNKSSKPTSKATFLLN